MSKDKFNWDAFKKLQEDFIKINDFDDSLYFYTLDCLQAERYRYTNKKYDPKSKEWNDVCDEIEKPTKGGVKKYLEDWFKYLYGICNALHENPSQPNAKRFMKLLVNRIESALTYKEYEKDPNAMYSRYYLYMVNMHSTSFILGYLWEVKLHNSDAHAHITNYSKKRNKKRRKLHNLAEKNTPPPSNNTHLSFEWIKGDIKKLYESLIEKEYIDPKTTFERFKQAFTLDSTTSSTPPIKWKLNTTLLCYFIYQMADNFDTEFGIDDVEISNSISSQFGYTKDQIKSATRWRIGRDRHHPKNHKQIDALLDCPKYKWKF